MSSKTAAIQAQSPVPSSHESLENYRTLFAWMLLPMLLSIGMDCWRDFSDNTWNKRLHYGFATLWYDFLILQPWLATYHRMTLHRALGMNCFFEERP